MIRKIALTLGLGVALLFGAAMPATAATAADAPPTNTTVTYAPKTAANIVMLDTNLATAQRTGITEYDLRVVIQGQPTRNLAVKTLPTTLFNIIPGTRMHVYLTLKGDFGTSSEYDGGSYTQGDPATTASTAPSSTPSSIPTRTSVTPTPSRTSTPSATSTLTQTPSRTTSATPAPTGIPVATTTASPAATPGATAGTTDNSVGNVLQTHFAPILMIAVITAGVLGLIAVLRRRRQG